MEKLLKKTLNDAVYTTHLWKYFISRIIDRRLQITKRKETNTAFLSLSEQLRALTCLQSGSRLPQFLHW